MTRVSVVVPTYNRLAQLQRVIVGLERQAFPRDRFEVIVVSDGSSDGTEDYLTALKTPLLLRPILQQHNQGPSAARNHGVALSTGDIVLFIDDDVVPAPELIEEHVRIHDEHGPHVAVIGPMLAPPDFQMSPWAQWEHAVLSKQYKNVLLGHWEPTASQFYTGNASLLRHHFQEIGGFDQSLRRAEDVDLGYRLAAKGLRFLFAPRAIGYHYAERNYLSWSAIPYTYGRYDVTLAQQKGQTWLLPKIFREFRTRHLLTKCLIWLCLDRHRISKATTSGLREIAETAHRFKLMEVSRLACSAIFNLRNYQGVADGLGGRKQFFAGRKLY